MMDLENAKTTLGDEFSFFCDLFREQLEILGLPSDARVLDVGTGMGRAAITLALSGYRVLTGEPAVFVIGIARFYGSVGILVVFNAAKKTTTIVIISRLYLNFRRLVLG